LVQKIQFSENTGRIFENKVQQRKCENVLTLILETCSTDQRHETGRLKHTRTEENVITVDEMVGLLNHKGQKQTYRPTHLISKETDLINCSIVQIIHCIFDQRCILFTKHACSLLLLVFLAFVFHKVV